MCRDPVPTTPLLPWDPDSPVVSTKHIDGIFIGYHRVLAAPGDREGRIGSGQDPPGGHLATILGTGGSRRSRITTLLPQDRWRPPSSTSTPKGLRTWGPTLPPHGGAPGLQLHIYEHNVTRVRGGTLLGDPLGSPFS